MKRHVSIVIAVVIFLFACNQAASVNADSPSQADRNGASSEPQAKKTKLEAFGTKYGVVVVRGFTEIGQVSGEYGGGVEVSASEFTNVNTGEKQRGVSIRVKEAGSLEREETSYIDYDEIESLLKGIDYIAKADHSTTKLQQFQADYATRGGFVLSTFSTATSGTMASVASGRIGGAHIFVTLADLAHLRAQIATAKATLDNITAAEGSGKK